MPGPAHGEKVYRCLGCTLLFKLGPVIHTRRSASALLPSLRGHRLKRGPTHDLGFPQVCVKVQETYLVRTQIATRSVARIVSPSLSFTKRVPLRPVHIMYSTRWLETKRCSSTVLNHAPRIIKARINLLTTRLVKTTL